MTKSDFLARYTRIENESTWHGAKQYTILGEIALRPTVPPRSRNNYTASGLKTHLTFVAHLSQKNRRKVARKAGITPPACLPSMLIL